MLVALKRPVFLEGQLFAPAKFGTEIPDSIGGKKVVFRQSGKPLAKDEICLPSDAAPFAAPDPKAEVFNSEKPAQTALSELTRKK